MRHVLLLATILALGGCGFTTQGDAIRSGIETYGSQAMDEGLNSAEFFICRAASVGSVIRRYGKDKAQADAWKTLCLGDPDADILEPPAQ